MERELAVIVHRRLQQSTTQSAAHASWSHAASDAVFVSRQAEKNSALRAYFDSPEVERAFESTLEPLPPPVLPPLRKRG